jgi:hypothetical protein
MAHSANASRIGFRHLRFVLSGLAIAVAAAALASPAAASLTAPGMSIAFPSKTANVSGPGALIVVKCAGSGARECAGTLTVEGLSESHSVSYAVAKGEQRSLVVPLGAERDFFTGIASPKMRVVAETMQSTGSSVRTVRVLRFK